jgi:hypothetical protein
MDCWHSRKIVMLCLIWMLRRSKHTFKLSIAPCPPAPLAAQLPHRRDLIA